MIIQDHYQLPLILFYELPFVKFFSKEKKVKRFIEASKEVQICGKAHIVDSKVSFNMQSVFHGDGEENFLRVEFFVCFIGSQIEFSLKRIFFNGKNMELQRDIKLKRYIKMICIKMSIKMAKNLKKKGMLKYKKDNLETISVSFHNDSSDI